MTPFLAELIGTAIILIFGSGVVANVVLDKTKGNNSGWIVISFGWAIGVFTGVFVAAPFSGAHLNPAVTIALVFAGKFSISKMPIYITAQILGAMLGSILVWAAYRKHFEATSDKGSILAVFCTTPNIRSYFHNLVTEGIATFVLAFAVLYMVKSDVGLGALNALPVALVVLGLGLSLGGPTGYAINPARDIGPRIIHFILPIPNKGSSDWNYAFVPIIGPIIGAIAAGLIYLILK
jgi:glycerol uptake facilitator protein